MDCVIQPFISNRSYDAIERNSKNFTRIGRPYFVWTIIVLTVFLWLHQRPHYSGKKAFRKKNTCNTLYPKDLERRNSKTSLTCTGCGSRERSAIEHQDCSIAKEEGRQRSKELFDESTPNDWVPSARKLKITHEDSSGYYRFWWSCCAKNGDQKKLLLNYNVISHYYYT